MTEFIIYVGVGLSIIFILGCLIGIIEALEIDVPDPFNDIINEDWEIKYGIILVSGIFWPILFPLGILCGFVFLTVFLTKKLIKKFFIKD